MSDTGLTLQLEKKPNVLRDAHLLIIADNDACFEEIERVLQAMEIQPQYKNVSKTSVQGSLPLDRSEKYDLILYYYSQSNNGFYNSKSVSSCDNIYPIRELAWWYELSSPIPLILITEPLGEERAIACLQSGISGYLLKSNIYNLPHLLEKTLNDLLKQKYNYLQQSSERQKLGDRIIQLEQKLIQLEKKNCELEQVEENSNQNYFSHLTHELRSPLANILQFARMLKEKIYGDLNTKQTEYISGIITSGSHLKALIDNYLDLAKIDANHEKLYPEKVPVEEICDSSLTLVRGKAKEKELELVLKIAEDIDFCYADSLRLTQILINLLSNAIKFTKKGSVTLEVKIVSETLLFSVIDTGIGISQENVAKLFQPFQQINSPLQRRYEGTGLGLALSRKLAQLHGGDITLTSQIGKGSCFTVSIPHCLI